jgi:hypothetical protein
MLGRLEGFQRLIARRLMGCAPVYLRRYEQWEYPPMGDAMEEAGLFIIEEYTKRRRNNIAEFVATRSIYAVCHELESGGGGGDHQKWGSQLDNALWP